MSTKNRVRNLLPLVCLFAAAGSYCADENGNFSVKGSGRLSCEKFVELYDEKDRGYYVSGGWVEGYISAQNELSDDTFDVAAWRSTDLITGLLVKHCRDNPDAMVYAVMHGIVEQIRPESMRQASPLITVRGDDNKTVLIYQSALLEMHQILAKRGFYAGDVSADFSQASADALKRYQEASSLPVTGLPDQLTLWALFSPPKS